MAKTQSLEFYLQKARDKHKNKFDYYLITSLNRCVQNVDIICPIHGVFRQRLDHHITSPHGCKLCSNFGRKTQKEFIQEAINQNHYYHKSLMVHVLLDNFYSF
ncbi:MAG: DUF723 domain-containing protein [bacterium]|nr:DUF723 domain-containing protein [bacterium]